MPGIQCFRNELLRQLDMRADLSKDYLLAATFIDPRFKTALFTNQVKQAKVYIENLALSCLPGPITGSSAPECSAQSASNSIQSTAVEMPSLNHKESLLDSVFEKVDNAKKEASK